MSHKTPGHVTSPKLVDTTHTQICEKLEESNTSAIILEGSQFKFGRIFAKFISAAFSRQSRCVTTSSSGERKTAVTLLCRHFDVRNRFSIFASSETPSPPLPFPYVQSSILRGFVSRKEKVAIVAVNRRSR